MKHEQQSHSLDQKELWALIIQRAYALARRQGLPQMQVRGNRKLFEQAAVQIRQENSTKINPDIIKK